MLKGSITAAALQKFQELLTLRHLLLSHHKKKVRTVTRKVCVSRKVVLTCHVDGKGPVSSPACVPAHDFAVFHDRALVPSSSDQPHGPHGHLAGCAHLQEAADVA